MASFDLPTVIDLSLAAVGIMLLWAPELLQRVRRVMRRPRRRSLAPSSDPVDLG